MSSKQASSWTTPLDTPTPPPYATSSATATTTTATTADSSSSSSSLPYTLVLSKNSLRNASYTCDAAGYHFRLSTPTDGFKRTRVTSVYRWDSASNTEVLVAEWERNIGKTDRFGVRGLTDAGWGWNGRPVQVHGGMGSMGMGSAVRPELTMVMRNLFLPKSGGVPLMAYGDRSFIAENGRRYKWKVRPLNLRLYPTDGPDADIFIAEYKRRNFVFNRRGAIINLAPEALEIMSSLLVTFLFCERDRRTQELILNVAGTAGTFL